MPQLKNKTATVRDFLGLQDEPVSDLLTSSVREILVRIGTVGRITGLSAPTIYRLMAKRAFPTSVKITSYARAWKLSEIMEWIDTREREDA